MGASAQIIPVLAVIAASAACGSPAGPSSIGGETEAGIVIVEPGWSIPVKLAVNDGGWEDSAYITRDGGEVLFFYHPARDIITNPRAALNVQLDGQIYRTRRPFRAKLLHDVSRPDAVSEAGPYVSARGSFFYHRTFPDTGQPNRIVRDGTILNLGTGGHESNPHYCDAMDELYFDANDQDLLLFRNGRATALPPPINVAGAKDFQPFLTDDCQTMYFTSTRGGGLGDIYRSRRSGEFNWGAPERFIYSGLGGVGELTLTGDGRQLVLVLVRRLADGLTADMYHSQR